MAKNLFIALEGLDGSGKSTQAKLLTQRLESKGHKVYTTCEPTEGPIGRMIREIFNHRMEGDQRTIAALFVADRLEHLLNQHNGIVKMMKDGYTVITDRYYFSSYAYHGVHVDMNWVMEMNKPCAEILRPDLTIYIDISPEVSMQRISKDRSSVEMYETLENQKKVHSKYQEAFNLLKSTEKILAVNGDQLVDKISSEIGKAVDALQ